MLATATRVGSLAAAPITRVSRWPFRLIRPLVWAPEAAGVADPGAGVGGTGDAVGRGSALGVTLGPALGFTLGVHAGVHLVTRLDNLEVLEVKIELPDTVR